MMRLFALCWMNDGVHWLIISSNGDILNVSSVGFPTEEAARRDLDMHF